MKAVGWILGAVVGAGVAGAAVLFETNQRDAASQAIVAKLASLERKVDELEKSQEALQSVDLDDLVAKAVERSMPREASNAAARTEPSDSAAVSKKDAPAAQADTAVAAVDSSKDVDPYGISVPPEAERQIRAIYGRLKEEEKAKQRERDEQRREDAVHDRVDKLADELNLNAQQKPAVERVLLDESRKRAELFQQNNDDNGGNGRRGRRDFSQIGDDMRRITQERDAALQTVLDFDQMKKFRESDNRRGRFFGGGPGGPGGAPSDGG
jgi:hypothetical protein